MEDKKENKENIVMSYLKHPGKWFSALLGRSTPVSIPQNQVTYQNQPNEANPTTPSQPVQQPKSTDDPLVGDLQKAGGFFKKIGSKIQEVSKPALDKGKEASGEAVSASSEFVKTDKFKKILPMALFLIVLIGVLGAGYYFLTNYMNRRVEPTIVTGPTPTAVEYAPSIPSLYASDETVLKLEQEISVLDREIAGAQLRETTLTPPTLDFNINFQ